MIYPLLTLAFLINNMCINHWVCFTGYILSSYYTCIRLYVNSCEVQNKSYVSSESFPGIFLVRKEYSPKGGYRKEGKRLRDKKFSFRECHEQEVETRPYTKLILYRDLITENPISSLHAWNPISNFCICVYGLYHQQVFSGHLKFFTRILRFNDANQ